jgi:hypothetical protein
MKRGEYPYNSRSRTVCSSAPYSMALTPMVIVGALWWSSDWLTSHGERSIALINAGVLRSGANGGVGGGGGDMGGGGDGGDGVGGGGAGDGTSATSTPSTQAPGV